MAFKHILDKVSADCGFTGLLENDSVRDLAVRLINEAAEEIWEERDLPGSLWEITVRVNANKQLALPPTIGEIRGVRESVYEQRWELKDLRPRYVDFPWESKFNTWRRLGEFPLQLEILNAAPLELVVPVAESSITVTITGSTVDSARVSEVVTLSSTSNLTTNSFVTIESLVKNSVSTYDITVRDVDSRDLAVIPNHALESRYLLVDVSQYPELGTCSDGKFVMEVLYKIPLKRMEEDGDSFPVPGFDKIIADKVKQNYVGDQPGREMTAIILDKKVTRDIERKVNHKEQDVNKKLEFGRNKYSKAMDVSGLQYM